MQNYSKSHEFKNEIISKFMGGFTVNGNLNGYALPHKRNSWYAFKDMEYHTSWDWIMDVIDKIESLGYDTIISKSRGEHEFQIWKSSNKQRPDATDLMIDDDFGGRSKKETVYDSIFEFIESYMNRESK